METMLPQTSEGEPRLVEFFGESEQPRNGWVVITEKD